VRLSGTQGAAIPHGRQVIEAAYSKLGGRFVHHVVDDSLLRGSDELRIDEIEIVNFKAITRLHLSGLGDTVIVAGPNGSGKSCLFDAIRLLKSAYGGYQPNEWQNWFGEFHLAATNDAVDWLPLLQDSAKQLELRACIRFSTDELKYLRENGEELLTEQIWREIVPELTRFKGVGAIPLAARHRAHEPTVESRVAKELPVLLKELDGATFTSEIVVSPQGKAVPAPNRVLELVFSRYDPQHLGIVDYHGATRTYTREKLGGISLSIESTEERMRQHALYNYANKYANLKTEMAGGFVRQLLSKEAGAKHPLEPDLGATLKELFLAFFPGKEFAGLRPTEDGRLLFPVKIPTGREHDIDELSSGEKEVLYGYLRLRNAAPRNSVLLIDEPELHLNPRLVRGLATFYHRHLAKPLGTQLWLVTHSDTLIREAVGQEGFSVYHLQPAGQYEGSNQATPVVARADLDRVIIDLVGDLAGFRPGAKMVVFEGGGDTAFDVRMVSTLFPRFQAMTNAISGGNKRRVGTLYELLEQARHDGHIPGKFYAITDGDGEERTATAAVGTYSWDVYHIENYLLEPYFVHRVLSDLNRAVGEVATESGVLHALAHCAQQTVPDLIGHQLRVRVNHDLTSCIDLNYDPRRDDAANALAESVDRSVRRIREVCADTLAVDTLRREEERLREATQADLSAGSWVRTFRGRDVLKRFVGTYGGGISYDMFRDLIVARMRDVEYQPTGMGRVIHRILTD
jgi:predicted ATPase